MRKAYDNRSADRLVPLLRNIHKELRERSDAVRRLENRVRNLSEQELDSTVFYNLQAELATHHRETRLAKKELARLGCALDESHPYRVLIPGVNGELEPGFAWALGDTRVQATPGEEAS